jgi:hypothetical protein
VVTKRPEKANNSALLVLHLHEKSEKNFRAHISQAAEYYSSITGSRTPYSDYEVQ